MEIQVSMAIIAIKLHIKIKNAILSPRNSMKITLMARTYSDLRNHSSGIREDESLALSSDLQNPCKSRCRRMSIRHVSMPTHWKVDKKRLGCSPAM